MSTNASGYYKITGLTPQTYTVTASAFGYALQSRDVPVASDQTAHANFALVPDTTPPSITIAKPAVAGEYVSGDGVTGSFIKVYVTDATGVAWVKLSVDKQPTGDMWQESDYWRYNWNTGGTAVGSHTIQVDAQDTSPRHNLGSASRSVYANPAVSCTISFLDGHALWKRDTDESIKPPQWDAGDTNPIAYTIGSQMTVELNMTSDDVTGPVLVHYDVGGTWLNSEGSQKGTYSKEKDGSGTLPYSLAHYPGALSWVMDYRLDQSYDVYVRKSASSEWCPVATVDATLPQVYLVFGAPLGPWGQTPGGAARTCWSRVIADACTWMPEDGYTADEHWWAKGQLAYKAFWSSGQNYADSGTHCTQNGTRFAMWDFIQHWNPATADCQDMSSWWVKLCNSIGTNGQLRWIDDPDPATGDWFGTKGIDPVGAPGWTNTAWNFHQVGYYTAVFDACLQLDPTVPRVPQGEEIDGSYKTDLFDPNYSHPPGTPDPTWSPYDPFSLVEVD